MLCWIYIFQFRELILESTIAKVTSERGTGQTLEEVEKAHEELVFNQAFLEKRLLKTHSTCRAYTYTYYLQKVQHLQPNVRMYCI